MCKNDFKYVLKAKLKYLRMTIIICFIFLSAEEMLSSEKG